MRVSRGRREEGDPAGTSGESGGCARTSYLVTRPSRWHFHILYQSSYTTGTSTHLKGLARGQSPGAVPPLPPTWEEDIGGLPLTTQAPSLEKQIR